MKFYKRIMCGVLAVGMCVCGLGSCTKKDVLKSHYQYDLSRYIKLPEYKGLEAVGRGIILTEERIQAEIMAPVYYYAQTTSVTDRPAAAGDSVIVSYIGVCDGIQTETHSEFELDLGIGMMPQEFEAAVIGHEVGDVFHAVSSYPDPYETLPECAGKTVEYTISLDAIFETKLPGYTDDFVKAYLGYDSIEEYESAVRSRLEEFNESAETYHVITQLWSKVSGGAEILQYPEKELKETYDEAIDAHKKLAEASDISFTDYVTTYYSMTVDEFYEKMMEEAKLDVKDEMICYAIARAENITITEEEYEERAMEYAEEQYGLDSLEDFEEVYGKDWIYRLILCDKVREWIAAEAVMIDAEARE